MEEPRGLAERLNAAWDEVPEGLSVRPVPPWFDRPFAPRPRRSGRKVKQVPDGVKRDVFIRARWRCQLKLLCDGSRKLSRLQITVDHIIPRAAGGSNKENNLQAACESCNNIKGDKSMEEAQRLAARKLAKLRAANEEFGRI